MELRRKRPGPRIAAEPPVWPVAERMPKGMEEPWQVMMESAGEVVLPKRDWMSILEISAATVVVLGLAIICLGIWLRFGVKIGLIASGVALSAFGVTFLLTLWASARDLGVTNEGG